MTRNPIYVDEILLNEFRHLFNFQSTERFYFYPSWEVINRYYYVLMPIWSIRLYLSYYIYFLCCKRPRRWQTIQHSRREMIKIPMYLALMILSQCLDTILFHTQPIVPLLDYFLCQNYTILMRSTYSCMNLSHHFLYLVLLETSQLCSSQHSFV